MENPFEIIIEQLNSIERKLNELSFKFQTTKDNKQENDIMSLNKLADYLDQSKSTIYN
ncbi:MAG: hypothetical protein WCK78_19645 [Paludibacter sp.]